MRKLFKPLTMQEMVQQDLEQAQRDLYKAKAQLENAQHNVNFFKARADRLATELRILSGEHK